MAGKNSRSSKTAHVLNLLSGGTPEVKPDAVPPPREAPPPAPLEPAPPASDMSVPEAPSSAARRLSLQEELASSEQTAAPSPVPPASPASAAEGEASPQVLDTPPPTPSAPAPSPSVPEQASTELSDGAELFNVMQLLVAEKLERYVKLFGLCSCPRCLADAEALALTRLPAQYAVFPPDLLPTKLSVYRARYDSEITRQIIWACKSVMDSPRHILPAGSR